MQATPEVIKEFEMLHEKYLKADDRIKELQQKAIMGMKIIGVGCVDNSSKAEFMSLKSELADTLARMKELCDSLE